MSCIRTLYSCTTVKFELENCLDRLLDKGVLQRKPHNLPPITTTTTIESHATNKVDNQFDVKVTQYEQLTADIM